MNSINRMMVEEALEELSLPQGRSETEEERMRQRWSPRKAESFHLRGTMERTYVITNFFETNPTYKKICEEHCNLSGMYNLCSLTIGSECPCGFEVAYSRLKDKFVIKHKA